MKIIRDLNHGVFPVEQETILFNCFDVIEKYNIETFICGDLNNTTHFGLGDMDQPNIESTRCLSLIMKIEDSLIDFENTSQRDLVLHSGAPSLEPKSRLDEILGDLFLWKDVFNYTIKGMTFLKSGDDNLDVDFWNLTENKEESVEFSADVFGFKKERSINVSPSGLNRIYTSEDGGGKGIIWGKSSFSAISITFNIEADFLVPEISRKMLEHLGVDNDLRTVRFQILNIVYIANLLAIGTGFNKNYSSVIKLLSSAVLVSNRYNRGIQMKLLGVALFSKDFSDIINDLITNNNHFVSSKMKGCVGNPTAIPIKVRDHHIPAKRQAEGLNFISVETTEGKKILKLNDEFIRTKLQNPMAQSKNDQLSINIIPMSSTNIDVRDGGRISFNPDAFSYIIEAYKDIYLNVSQLYYSDKLNNLVKIMSRLNSSKYSEDNFLKIKLIKTYFTHHFEGSTKFKEIFPSFHGRTTNDSYSEVRQRYLDYLGVDTDSLFNVKNEIEIENKIKQSNFSMGLIEHLRDGNAYRLIKNYNPISFGVNSRHSPLFHLISSKEYFAVIVDESVSIQTVGSLTKKFLAFHKIKKNLFIIKPNSTLDKIFLDSALGGYRNYIKWSDLSKNRKTFTESATTSGGTGSNSPQHKLSKEDLEKEKTSKFMESTISMYGFNHITMVSPIPGNFTPETIRTKPNTEEYYKKNGFVFVKYIPAERKVILFGREYYLTIPSDAMVLAEFIKLTRLGTVGGHSPINLNLYFLTPNIYDKMERHGINLPVVEKVFNKDVIGKMLDSTQLTYDNRAAELLKNGDLSMLMGYIFVNRECFLENASILELIPQDLNKYIWNHNAVAFNVIAGVSKHHLAHIFKYGINIDVLRNNIIIKDIISVDEFNSFEAVLEPFFKMNPTQSSLSDEKIVFYLFELRSSIEKRFRLLNKDLLLNSNNLLKVATSYNSLSNIRLLADKAPKNAIRYGTQEDIDNLSDTDRKVFNVILELEKLTMQNINLN